VLFHGYGDTAENFILLGTFWRVLLPNTLFVAIEAPNTCKDMPGKKWLQASNKNKPQLFKEINLLTQTLNDYLDDLLEKHKVSPNNLALVGFSQGARIALHVGLRRPCAGVVGFSGSFLDDPTTKLHSENLPILLIHGLEDKKALPILSRESYKRLEELNMSVTLFLMPGIDHNIDSQGSHIAIEFLQDCFAKKWRA